MPIENTDMNIIFIGSLKLCFRYPRTSTKGGERYWRIKRIVCSYGFLLRVRMNVAGVLLDDPNELIPLHRRKQEEVVEPTIDSNMPFEERIQAASANDLPLISFTTWPVCSWMTLMSWSLFIGLL